MHYLFLTLALVVSINSFAIVNGNDINKILRESKSFVAISLKLPGLSAVPCSGTYVGEGQILTASHCLLMNDYPSLKPEICLASAGAKADTNTNVAASVDAANMQNCFKDADYEVLFPPQVEEGPRAPTRKLRRVIRIPKPDLVLLQIRADLVNKLAGFTIMPLSEDASVFISNPSWQLIIIGQGCTAYTEPGAEVPTPGIGIFRYGELSLSPELTSPLEFVSIWTKANQNAGLCWGDSGGALIALNQQTKKMVQVAVNSSTKNSYDRATGYIATVKSFFSRVDQTTTLTWLQQTIKSF